MSPHKKVRTEAEERGIWAEFDRAFAPEKTRIRGLIARALIAIPFVGLLAVALAIALVRAARAHDAPSGWAYDAACCSSVDCAQIPDVSVVATGQGWQVTLQPADHPMVTQPMHFVVAFNSTKVRQSKDEHFHACIGQASGSLFCLYVPDMGV